MTAGSPQRSPAPAFGDVLLAAVLAVLAVVEVWVQTVFQTGLRRIARCAVPGAVQRLWRVRPPRIE